MHRRPLTPTEYDHLRAEAMQRARVLREQALDEAWAAQGLRVATLVAASARLAGRLARTVRLSERPRLQRPC